MIDVGGNYVKLMMSGSDQVRRFKSGKKLTAAQMVSRARRQTRDWQYKAVSIGYPGLVTNGRPAREPQNLGKGWVEFDYERAFERPVRIIHDAAMQALAHYEGGRLLYAGFGSALVADDCVIPLELGAMRMTQTRTFMDSLSDDALARFGRARWRRAVVQAVEIWRAVFSPTDIVLGGGNTELLAQLPPGCRRGKNEDALLGARRLWKGAGLFAEPRGNTWSISRP